MKKIDGFPALRPITLAVLSLGAAADLPAWSQTAASGPAPTVSAPTDTLAPRQRRLALGARRMRDL